MFRIRSFVMVGLIIALTASFCLAQDEELPDTTGITTGPREPVKVNPASKARIKFESDMFEFGSIPRGATVVHAFNLKNTGADTLKITNVKPTCGCTTAPLSSNEIAPGQGANIRATFNSQKFNGRVTKQIYVDSSDPINPYLKVLFSATINDPLQIITTTPAEADFGSVAQNAKSQIKVTLLNTDSVKVNLAIVEESAPAIFKAALSRTTLAPKESAELIIDLAPQQTAGEIKESITLETTGAKASRFTVPVKTIIAL
jgi:hypothetical protein